MKWLDERGNNIVYHQLVDKHHLETVDGKLDHLLSYILLLLSESTPDTIWFNLTLTISLCLLPSFIRLARIIVVFQSSSCIAGRFSALFSRSELCGKQTFPSRIAWLDLFFRPFDTTGQQTRLIVTFASFRGNVWTSGNWLLLCPFFIFYRFYALG